MELSSVIPTRVEPARRSYDESMSPILQTVPLGTQWPTLDPFLFCAHHLDEYPNSNGDLGPDASLAGRQIGSDFAGVDGWNMYHGSSVPGFPQHPHRGFETVTYVRRGYCDHSDSLGAQARFGEGDVQWLTAGAGVVHSEMFPLFAPDAPNPLHLFQMWLNLPAANKMVDPYFSMLWNDSIPKFDSGDGVQVTVIAGSLDGHDAPTPPPDSWPRLRRAMLRSGISSSKRMRRGRSPKRALTPTASCTSLTVMTSRSPASRSQRTPAWSSTAANRFRWRRRAQLSASCCRVDRSGSRLLSTVRLS